MWENGERAKDGESAHLHKHLAKIHIPVIGEEI